MRIDEMKAAIENGKAKLFHEIQPEFGGNGEAVWCGLYELGGKEYMVEWEYPDEDDVDNPEDLDSWNSSTDWDNIIRVEEA